MPRFSKKCASLKRQIDELFQGTASQAVEFEASTSSPRLNELKKKSNGLKLILRMEKLNGNHLTSRDIADCIQYTTFGGQASRAKWVQFTRSSKCLQTVLLRINCRKEYVESSCLPFVDDFFQREWFELDKSVYDRQKFWRDIFYIPLTIQEQILEKISKNEISNKLAEKSKKAMYLVTNEQMAERNYPFPTEDEIVQTKARYKPLTDDSPLFAIDCEMCQTKMNPMELTRVSIVNEDGDIVLDTLVKPKNEITDYLTRWSGITEEQLANVTVTLENVQKAISNILPSDAILVGHSLENDLRALKMAHPYCIDISLLLNYTNNYSSRNSLKKLAEVFLDEEIQSKYGHCSYEDAWTAMKLIKMKMTNGLVFGNVNFGWNYSEFLKNSGSQDNRKIMRVSEEKIEKNSSFCTSCEASTLVTCTVEDCECRHSNSPARCVVCAESVEDSMDDDKMLDWSDSLQIEDVPSIRPLSIFLDDNKRVTVMSALSDIQDEVVHKRIEKIDPDRFESQEKFVDTVSQNVMNHKLILAELFYGDEEVPEDDKSLSEDGEISTELPSAKRINADIETIVKSACINSLIIVILTCEDRSILHMKIKN